MVVATCNCRTFHRWHRDGICHPLLFWQYGVPCAATGSDGMECRCGPYICHNQQFVSSAQSVRTLHSAFPPSTGYRPASSQPGTLPGAYFHRTCSGRTDGASACSKQSEAAADGMWCTLSLPISLVA